MAELAAWRNYAERLSQAALRVSPLAGSEAFTQVQQDVFLADPIFVAQRVDTLRADVHVLTMRAARIMHALTAARALLASVDHDNNGETIGMQRIGGNGGLISLKTTRAADTLRLALDKLDNGS